MPTLEHKGLPVHGYQTQTEATVMDVNINKELEEAILRRLDSLQDFGYTDKRWLAIGRTKIEEAFMAINRAIFQPQRIKL